MNENEILKSNPKTKKIWFYLYVIPLLVILVFVFATLLLTIQNKLNKALNENNELKQQISSTNNLKSGPADSQLVQNKLTLNSIKSFDYDQIKLSVYTFDGPQAEGFYLIKQENTPYEDWGRDGSYNHSVILTRNPSYGDGSYADIVDDKLIALNASTNSITVFQINDQDKQYKSFTPLETMQLPENFSGVPYSVMCSDSTTCNIQTAWHFEGGCSGSFLVDNYTFENITCGQGYSE